MDRKGLGQTGPFALTLDGGVDKKWSANLLEILFGPITRAQPKRFKDALNSLIQEV